MLDRLIAEAGGPSWSAAGFARLQDAVEADYGDELAACGRQGIRRQNDSGSHATTEQACREGLHVRSQLPLNLTVDSEPEPDVALVTGEPRDHVDSHPESALLIVEVSDSSLASDRERKHRAYARAGIPEYWILDLVHGCLEVHTDPRDDRYASNVVYSRGDHVRSGNLAVSIAVCRSPARESHHTRAVRASRISSSAAGSSMVVI